MMFIGKLFEQNLFVQVATLSTALFSVSSLIQTLEFFKIRSVWSNTGIWKKDILAKEVFTPLLWDEKFFYQVLALRLIAGVLMMLWPHALPGALLLLSSIFINMRWRGTFNGGSDMMTIVVGSGLVWYWLLFDSNPEVAKWGLYYIAAQSVISYFVAGVIKIKNVEWRSGLALKAFLNSSIYTNDYGIIARILEHPKIIFALTWATLIFECLFPLALFNHFAAWILVLIAATFHFANIFIFGLNRFFWAWAATWPCIIAVTYPH